MIEMKLGKETMENGRMKLGKLENSEKTPSYLASPRLEFGIPVGTDETSGSGSALLVSRHNKFKYRPI